MNKEFDILDFISLMSFIISLENLEENRQQTNDAKRILNELEYHLKKQDKILENQNKILFKLNGGKND